eukprot:COSAG01_NODE_12587_length_1714_cov_9.747988_2_plen_111_part_00
MTEICLCHACSDQDIEDGHARTGRAAASATAAAADDGLGVGGAAVSAAELRSREQLGWNVVHVHDRYALVDLGLARDYAEVLLHHPGRVACKLNSMHAEQRGYMEVAHAW